MKKELLWSLPLAGPACYILGYPFLERHSRSQIRKNPKLKGKDIATAKKACGKFKTFPTTVISFTEGTRFTEQKKLKQQSPYDHLLKPKAGAIAVVINEMQQYLDSIIDVTIKYSEPTLSLWQLVCGNFDKITIHYKSLPLTKELLGNYYQDRAYRATLQKWLNQIWQDKDNLLK